MPPRFSTPEEFKVNFWRKVEKNGPIPEFRPELGPCWIWSASLDSKGYGHLGWLNRDLRAHRVSYEFIKGKIPEGLELDHLCRVRSCVNPKHLEAVTRRINNLRGDSPAAHQAKQTHCKHGHALTIDNISPTIFARLRKRICLACHAATERERRKKLRGIRCLV